MTANDKPKLVYATCPSLAEAERIGGALVEHGLAACVNILPDMVSVYMWQGQRRHDSEVVMLAKTRGDLADRVVEVIRGLHSYDTPAVLVLDVEGGSAPFLAWILSQTATPR